MTVAQYAVRERGATGNVGKSFLHTQHAPRPRAATRKKIAAKVPQDPQATKVLLAEIADAEAAKPDHSAGSPAVGRYCPG